MGTLYVNDLTGLHLDYWVARAEGLDAVRDGARCLLRGQAQAAYAPTQDARLFEALVARHGVDIFAVGQRWGAELKGRDTPWGNGATRVEAALRAIVAARFGDTVEDDEGAAELAVIAATSSTAAASPLQCFWLAFMASGDAAGQAPRPLGHAIFEAPDMDAAVALARAQGLHPGADVRVYRVNEEDAHHIPADLRNRPLSRDEAAALGWQEA